MRLRFVTSIPDFMEGRIIEIDPRSQQAIAWLRAGVAVPEKSLEEATALEPEAVERAVLRRNKRGKRSASAVATAEDD